MGKPSGFKEFKRKDPTAVPAEERVKHYQEFLVQLPPEELQKQGARCMDCGIPFCHAGCPLGNHIPDFNDLVYRDSWKRASEILHSTNNFPEFTGRTCPAPCEDSCVLAINEPAVTIKNIENAIVERAFEEGWIPPQAPAKRSGKRVAVVGSGPAGLACASQLNLAGHSVTVFERAAKLGGLLRYGIPDFKLEKWVIDRRIEIMREEGVTFRVNTTVGKDVSADDLEQAFDAVVLCVGSSKPRALRIPGMELEGVEYAMEFLTQQNLRLESDAPDVLQQFWWSEGERKEISAAGKHVVVIGGGDTGSDCVGVSNRQGAKSVRQFQYKPMPPNKQHPLESWPFEPMKLQTSSSHEEGCERAWSTSSVELVAESGSVVAVKTVELQWNATRSEMKPVAGTEKRWPAELVLIAIGFSGPESLLAEEFNLESDEIGRIRKVQEYQCPQRKVFVCGDMRRGQSLVVWAISEGREAAHAVDAFLLGETSLLPTKGAGDLQLHP